MRLTSKGQLTIPKNLREKFGIGPHSEVEVIADGNTLRVVKKVKLGTPVDKVYGILGKKSQSTDKLIKQLRGR